MRATLLLPLAESLAVTTLITDEFLNTIFASVPLTLLCFSSISKRSSADRGFNSYIIFSSTFRACPLVPDAIQIFVPGYRMHRVTQYTALKNDLPSTLLPYKLFILHFLQFPVRSAYIFTLELTVGWRTLVAVLLLPLTLNRYALRFR